MLGYRGGEYKTFSSEAAALEHLQQRGVDPLLARQQRQEHELEQQRELPQPQAQQNQRQQPAAAPTPGVHRQAPATGSVPAAGAPADGWAAETGGEQFTDPAAARQFQRQFNAPVGKAGDGLGSRLACTKRIGRPPKVRPPQPPPAARRAAKAATPEEQRAQQAMSAFAKAWREKNKPTPAEIKRTSKAQAEKLAATAAAAYAFAQQGQAAAAGAGAAPSLRTPLERLQAERAAAAATAAAGAANGPAAAAGGAAAAAGAPPADPGDRRAFHRNTCQAMVAGASSFAQASPGPCGCCCCCCSVLARLCQPPLPSAASPDAAAAHWCPSPPSRCCACSGCPASRPA